jgi:hypothetical protein
MTAAILWIFIVTFPILLDSPVIVPIATVSQPHCERVRKLMMKQLDDHRSNAAVSPCVRALLTVEEVP